MTDPRPTLVVKKGTCYALYAYDVGLWIDLEKCKVLLAGGAQEGRLQINRRTPKYFDYRPAPLLYTQEVRSLKLGPHAVLPGVDILLYDFGGVSIGYEIPFTGSLGTLLDISCELEDNSALLDDSRRRVEGLLKLIGKAVQRPCIADLVEDYAVFQVDEYETPTPVDALHSTYPQEFAKILRGERQTLSPQEVSDALQCRISFAHDDVTLIDWYGALIFDREADDVRAVLEFANLELLEMRYLDRQLDDALDRSYEIVSRRGWIRNLVPGLSGASARAVSQMQVDGAILFERVTNAPKLLGDQFLARVYRLTAQRFHLGEWNASTLRKLDAIEGIYKQMHDRSASWRLEVLEWIIIVLIAFEIVWPFVEKAWVP